MTSRRADLKVGPYVRLFASRGPTWRSASTSDCLPRAGPTWRSAPTFDF